MKLLRFKILKRRFTIILLTFILMSSLTNNYILFKQNLTNSSQNFELKDDSEILDSEDDLLPLSSNLNSNRPRFNSKLISDWRAKVQKSDQNNNGINDDFDIKLDLMNKSEELSIYSTKDLNNNLINNEGEKPKTFSHNKIPIIVQFPFKEYIYATNIFKNLGGRIKNDYQYAINGFAGEINYKSLINFKETLLSENYPFLIEEDSIVEANLYYTSRNLNLRPYVWNNLSYDGDEYSSIAIIDSGIDDSHNFFPTGYSSGDFSSKIVGWRDEVNGIPVPYDDNGHGSHCAGIATGEGNASLDSKGRPVATYAFVFDDTGYYWDDGDYINITVAVFNVTNAGNILIESDFDDFTPGNDQVHISPFLLYGDTIVDSYSSEEDFWTYTLNYSVPINSLGTYSLSLGIYFEDNNGDDEVWDPYMRINTQIHWPFDPPLFESGDPWKGIAPDAHLVGVKVLNEYGSGSVSDIIAGVEWVISNKELYNITVISMSLGGIGGFVALIDAVNNAVENGIVVVVAAGNSGGGDEERIGSPGDADNVITVGATSIIDRIAEYSSSGGLSYTEFTIKPDIVAPGGSRINFTMFSADTNDNDGEGEYSTDSNLNDMYPAVGTSMSTPVVAGAANLLIEALGGHQNWNYSAIEAKLVKALLLMTATETYPLTREVDTEYSAELNRGTKDPQEGYGRINVDAAIEAIIHELMPESNLTKWLTSSIIDPFSNHALGCHVKLNESENYKFILDVPSGADFDLFLYNKSASSIGDPILLAQSNSSILGQDEFFSFTPTHSGKFYLVAKVVEGEGLANISFIMNNFLPSLSAGSVSSYLPANQSSLLNFSVIYTDLDNMEPTYVRVLINDTPYLMEQQDISDNDYSDGCVYQFTTYLQPGNYYYSFDAKDGRFSESTSIYTGLDIMETNLFAPTMSMAQVSPDKGLVSNTPFLYSINYIDQDNNAPIFLNITINFRNYTMIKQDPLDVNYMDGCIYVFNVILNESKYYNYSFYCFDGNNYLLSDTYYGPTVCSTKTIFQDDFESGLSKWEDINGLWHLTDDSSAWPDPYHSPTHSMWFGQESTGNYDLGTMHFGDMIMNPIDLSDENTAFLEFYHWREGDRTVDPSYVGITRDMDDIETIYFETDNIEPWEKVSINISEYCGDDSVWIIFRFVSFWIFYPDSDDYRGWLIDDVKVYSWIEPNEYAPELTSENLSPSTGNQTTELHFSVNYKDKDNNKPSYVNVVINDTSYPLEKEDPLDTFYYDGCNFHTFIYLQPGNYEYRFECSDGNYINSTITYTGLTISTHPGTNPPTLTNGKVSHTLGWQGATTFGFSVIYTDLDNNAPDSVNVTINSTAYSMTKNNVFDTNYMDGCEYIYSTKLNEIGNYIYYFNCSDGFSDYSDGPYTDLEVYVWYGLINYQIIPEYAYNWIDATPSNGGIRCDMDSEDDEAQSFYLPFSFRFYDQIFDSIYVCTNGFASFLNEDSYSNRPFPTDDYELMIAPFWSDLYADYPCNIYVLNLTNPNRVVIAWLNIESFWGDKIGSFEIVLYENGDIIFNYDNITYIDELDGYTCGLNYGLNTNYYNMYTGLYVGIDNFSILFRYEPSKSLSSGGNGGENGKVREDDIVILALIIGSLSVGGAVATISIIIIKKKKLKLSRTEI